MKNKIFRVTIMLFALAFVFLLINLLPAQAAGANAAVQYVDADVDCEASSSQTSWTSTYINSTSSSTSFTTTSVSTYFVPTIDCVPVRERNRNPVAVESGVVASKGNCSVFLVNAANTDPSLNNIQSFQNLSPTCEVSYGNGGPVAGWVYVNLNSYTASRYENGKITIYTKTSDGLKACENPTFIPNGTYGMLGCYASQVTIFGLGNIN